VICASVQAQEVVSEVDQIFRIHRPPNHIKVDRLQIGGYRKVAKVSSTIFYWNSYLLCRVKRWVNKKFANAIKALLTVAFHGVDAARSNTMPRLIRTEAFK
jgi:hypothetical protein